MTSRTASAGFAILHRLARNEALLREAEGLARVGHWEWDLDSGRFTFMADEIFTIYGITHSDFEGTLEAFLSFVPPEDRRIVKQAIDKARGKGTTEVEHCIVRPDGEVRFVRTRSQAISTATPVLCAWSAPARTSPIRRRQSRRSSTPDDSCRPSPTTWSRE